MLKEYFLVLISIIKMHLNPRYRQTMKLCMLFCHAYARTVDHITDLEYKQSFGGTKFENGFEKSKHLVN